jgi:predicted dehydrogenase
MTNPPVRWGVIGPGRIAATFVADLQETESGMPFAVGSRQRESADRFADAHGIPRRYGSYAELVADPDVDAIYVATPHPFHHAAARLALEAGKPTLVEKAFTMDAAQARDLVTLARARGVFLMEAMWTRFLPHVIEMRRLVAEGALGDLVAVYADHGQWFAPDPENRLFAPQLGGGALLDLGVYVVSFASMVLGGPDRVVALVDPAFTGVDGQTSILLGHPTGTQAVLTCTSAARTATRATIVGTRARIESDERFYGPGGFTLIPRDGEGEPARCDPPSRGRGLWYQAAEVARCLQQGLTESPTMPLDETIAVMETMDAVLAQAPGAAAATAAG